MTGVQTCALPIPATNHHLQSFEQKESLHKAINHLSCGCLPRLRSSIAMVRSQRPSVHLSNPQELPKTVLQNNVYKLYNLATNNRPSLHLSPISSSNNVLMVTAGLQICNSSQIASYIRSLERRNVHGLILFSLSASEEWQHQRA